ncbi:MAG: hypothetical protein M3Z31_03190 [Pseudomonadota bacterium]|nr:hypothetical protein [Pseudomonadota bacterium]
MSGDIPIARYPAARGASWFKEAFVMFSAARMPWIFMLLSYYAIMAVVDVLPVIGHIAVPVLKPVFAVGFLAAAWAQERGQRPAMKQLFQGFRANLRALLPLGVLLLAGATAAVMATTLVDGGALVDALSGKTVLDEDRLASGKMQQAMLFGAAVALPVLLALWYAPALVVFHDCRAPRALAASFRACILNWRPLGLYALMVTFYAVVVPGLVAALIAALVPRTLATAVAFTVMLPYLLSLVATLHISDYLSYRDIFHSEEKPRSSPAA